MLPASCVRREQSDNGRAPRLCVVRIPASAFQLRYATYLDGMEEAFRDISHDA
jgi:hypothetical protein